MILSVMYMYFAGKGTIKFSPWWLAAAAVCDCMIIATIGDIITGESTGLISIRSE